MRLAVLSPQSPAQRGSSATARLEMFTYLPKGWQAELYYFGNPAQPKDISIGHYRPEGHPANVVALSRLLRQFFARHRHHPYDYVWTTLPPVTMALFAAVTAKWAGLPLVVDVRDPGISSARLAVSEHSLKYRLAWRLERWLYRQASIICCTTPELVRFLIEEFGVTSSKCHVISNAGPYKKKSRMRQPSQPLRLFFAGSFASYQIIKPFLKKLLAEKADLPNMRVDLYGYREMGEQLPQLIAEETGWIRLHRLVDRQKAFAAMTASDAVLVPIDGLAAPELYEYAIPLKYYEASAHSKPVLLFGGTKAVSRALADDGVGVHCPLDGNLAGALAELIRNFRKYQEAANQTTYLRKTEAKKLFSLLQ